MFVIWVFHLRSLEILTPRYFTVSEVGMMTWLICIDKDGFTRFLEMTSRVHFAGLMARPEHSIQEEMRSTSCWSLVLSLLEMSARDNNMSLAYKITCDPEERFRLAKDFT